MACPGRLKDFVNNKELYLGDVGFLVLDEADRMLELGFQEDVDDLRQLMRRPQVMFFSATWPEGVR